MTLRVFSYGGGWQSNAALVLAAQGQLDYRTFLFCNVGDDSEDPLTLAYVRDHAMPYARAHGLNLIEIRRIPRENQPKTLMELIMRENTPSIPVRFAEGMPAQRSCTKTFKIEVIRKWIKAHGATPENPATVAIGISLDEVHRANRKDQMPFEEIDYPLLDLRLRRKDIPAILGRAGLPVPPKSACWFCPMHRESDWMRMREERPGLFTRAVEIEASINERRDARGKDHVYLTRFGKPLDQAFPGGTEPLFRSDDGGECDSGYCFT